MLRADDVNMAPVYDPIYSIVEIAGAGNVDTVIIDGVVRKKDGKLTFPDDVLRNAARRTRRHQASASCARAISRSRPRCNNFILAAENDSNSMSIRLEMER